jgi:uncharacterized small protein (DUF1192 family)
MSYEVCEHGSLRRQCPLCDDAKDIAALEEEVARLKAQRSELMAATSDEIERLRAALLFLGKAFELEDDQTDSGFTYREALGHSAGEKP